MGDAPPQMEMAASGPKHHFDLNNMRSVMFQTKEGTKTLYAQNPPFSEAKNMILTCGCCPIIRFQGNGVKIEYKNDCRCFKQWETSVDGEKAGVVQNPGCLDNGIVFCLCPWCKCSGTIKYLSLLDTTGDSWVERYTLRKELYCCWPMLDGCCACCGSCGLAVQSMVGCCKYCGGQEYRTVRQPIYPALADGETPVGALTQVHRAYPSGPCCSQLELVRVQMELPDNSTTGDVANLGLIALFYNGTGDMIPCDCGKNIRVPQGVSCLDKGLNTTVEWKTYEEVMAAGAGEPGQQEMKE